MLKNFAECQFVATNVLVELGLGTIPQTIEALAKQINSWCTRCDLSLKFKLGLA